MNRGSLKSIVRGAYDLQKLRIETGNRVVANLKAKLGQKPGKRETTLSPEAKRILANLRKSYDRITDGAESFPQETSFEGDELISSYTELVLVAQYFELLEQESAHFMRLGKALNSYPIYARYLKGVVGVGPAMAGVIISEFDIHKARYPSSLWAYAGLDVMAYWELDDVRYVSGDRQQAEEYTEGDSIPQTKPLAGHDRINVTFDQESAILSVLHSQSAFSVLAQYRWVDKGGRSRKKEHLREIEYTDKNGEPAKRVGITFNPFVKTKLVGVLGPLFIKSVRWRDAEDEEWTSTPESRRRIKMYEDRGEVKQVIEHESPYRAIYYDYKNRLENHSIYGIVNDGVKDADKKLITSKARRHAMAVRYMVKRFLVDLYKEWRKLEGLPLSAEYSEEKLGIEHGAGLAAG